MAMLNNQMVINVLILPSFSHRHLTTPHDAQNAAQNHLQELRKDQADHS